MAHVNRAGVLSDTHEGKQCELLMNLGGNTSLTLVLLLGRGFLRVLNEQCRLRKEQNAVLAQCIL